MAKINFEFKPKDGPTEQFFSKARKIQIKPLYEKWGQLGVNALAAATPKDTGLTASSWRYEIIHTRDIWTLSFLNNDVVGYTVVAIILQYGHVSKSGGFVPGQDYINPAIQPIFDGLQSELEGVLNAL